MSYEVHNLKILNWRYPIYQNRLRKLAAQAHVPLLSISNLPLVHVSTHFLPFHFFISSSINNSNLIQLWGRHRLKLINNELRLAFFELSVIPAFPRNLAVEAVLCAWLPICCSNRYYEAMKHQLMAFGIADETILKAFQLLKTFWTLLSSCSIFYGIKLQSYANNWSKWTTSLSEKSIAGFLLLMVHPIQNPGSQKPKLMPREKQGKSCSKYHSS